MKNAMLPIALGVAVLGCVLAVYANMNSGNLKNVLDAERSKRFAAEQQVIKVQRTVSVLETQLGDAKSKMSSINKILSDGKQVEEEIMAELETIKKEREVLKQQLAEQEVLKQQLAEQEAVVLPVAVVEQ